MRVEPPWSLVQQPGFAGPRTVWRGAHVELLERNGAFEVVRADDVPAHRVPADAVRVQDADDPRAMLLFVPSAAGATLGEIVDESERQNARIDPGFALAIVEPVVHEMMLPRPVPAAVSIDHILVGFDGSARFRGHLPWWGERRAPRVPLGFVAPAVDAETMLLVVEVLSALLSSRRVRGVEGAAASLSDVARNFLITISRGVLAPDLEELWNAQGQAGPNPLALLATLAQLDTRGRASPEALGAFVQNLFPERWREEQRVREQIEGVR